MNTLIMSTLVKSGQDLKDIEGSCLDQDLLLAAEIGKSLLERNRELEGALKSTQELAEEKCAQAEFYVAQNEYLRERIEASSNTNEQLEASNQTLLDKCQQWKAEYKILEGKNKRLWDVINSLEKRIEDLTSELDSTKEELDDVAVKCKSCDSKISYEADIKINSINDYKHDIDIEDNLVDVNDDSSPCDDRGENECMKKQISELKVQIELEKLQKDEVESQLEDVIKENQLLYHKISNLNQEVHEWENFAQKEENYRRLAAAFTLKHSIEIDSNGEVFDKMLQETPVKSNVLARAKSCEFLNSNEKKLFLRSPNLVNNILSSVNSSSFLSELDTEYAELVKRYEALLEKCKQEGKINENPERTRKVQKAIQTLALDFAILATPVTSPNKSKISIDNSTSDEDQAPVRCSTPCDNEIQTMNESDVDYRKMFSEIFAKIKQSKEVFT